MKERSSRMSKVVGGYFAACLFVVGGCGGGDDDAAANASGVQGTCQTACAHVMQCKATGYQDSDLPDLTQAECMDGCVNYADAWTRDCTAQNTDCVALDDYCDVF